jgi:hypothetical protein
VEIFFFVFYVSVSQWVPWGEANTCNRRGLLYRVHFALMGGGMRVERRDTERESERDGKGGSEERRDRETERE